MLCPWFPWTFILTQLPLSYLKGLNPHNCGSSPPSSTLTNSALNPYQNFCCVSIHLSWLVDTLISMRKVYANIACCSHSCYTSWHAISLVTYVPGHCETTFLALHPLRAYNHVYHLCPKLPSFVWPATMIIWTDELRNIFVHSWISIMVLITIK